VVQLYPRALGSIFVASYDSQGYGGDILTRLHEDQPSVEVRVGVILRPTVSGTHLAPATNFYPPFLNYFRQLRVC
jgi:hypothetical protein